MSKHKMLDLFIATKEEAGDVVLSEVLPQIVSEQGEHIVEEGVATLAGEVIGAICPRINNIRLGYKQIRLERNVNKALTMIREEQDNLETRLQYLENHQNDDLKMITEMLLDQIIDEIEEAKVELNVEGYMHLILKDKINTFEALTFFKTLSQLNELDIQVLKLYSLTFADNITDVAKKFEASYDELEYAKQKLERYGLLHSKNDEIHDKNLQQIVKYLQNVEKESKKRNPRTIKLPTLKKVTRHDSYRITSLGNNFLDLIS